MQSFKRFTFLMLATFALLFGATWAFSIQGRQYFTQMHVGVYQAKFDMQRRCDLGRVVILGDSRAGTSYDPATLGPGVKNFAFTGHSPVEGYYFAKRLLDCPNKPEGVILAYSPQELSDLQWFWSVAAQSGILSLDELNEISAKASELGDHEVYKQQFGTELSPAAKNWSYIHHLPVYDFPTFLSLKYKINRDIYNQNAAMYRQTLAEGGLITLPGHTACVKGVGPESEVGRLKTNKVIDFYYRKIIDMLEAKQIKTIIAPLPYSEKSYVRIAPAFKVDLAAYYHSAIAGKEHVSVHPDMFVAVDDCQFTDDLHVNRQGAAAFSEQMRRELMPQFTSSAPLAKGTAR